MCPGGEIVNASSQIGGSLVNGMSYSTRNGKFSNSAIVVGISEKDFGTQIFSGDEIARWLRKENLWYYWKLWSNLPECVGFYEK